ncbi:MAG: hypothetical protein KDA76_11215 [Planctomycetaceae bacterium]|nr:hypothetical protein [Planctomycetaceae bacterium]
MERINTPQTRCRAGVARRDITPPVGMYHRMWGAALHDCSTGVHRPLEAAVLWLEPLGPASGNPRVIVSLDHCILDLDDSRRMRQSIADSTGVDIADIELTLTHTHGAGRITRTRADFPGGTLIGPYLDDVIAKLGPLAVESRARTVPVTMLHGQGHSTLAAERDYHDAQRDIVVCGRNPRAAADTTLLVVKIVDDQARTVATLVNYACHPTTLAWQNTLISPDYVGALRETVETHTQAPCLFLQGASADLGPCEGFVGDTEVADRNGRQLAYSVLATLEALPPAGTEYVYIGPVVSGAIIGAWEHRPLSEQARDQQTRWQWHAFTVDLPYRHDLADRHQTETERTFWLAEEEQARQAGNLARLRDCRAQVEQRERQLVRLQELPAGKVCPVSIRIGWLGDALWLFLPGEIYQVLQTTLRARFPGYPLLITTLSNDWSPGYIPPASKYGYGIYQEIIAATAPGSLELLIEAISRELHSLLAPHETRPQTHLSANG